MEKRLRDRRSGGAMRKLILGVALCALTVATGSAQTPPADVTAPIKRFIDAFNKGDMAAAAATHVAGPELVIVDEVAPFVWRGATAFTTWAGDLEADAKKQGMTEQRVTIAAATRTEMSADTAYVIVPAVYAFKLKGVAMREAAQMTYVMKKSGSGWLISSWTWTGPKAKAAGASGATARK
jgi:ketosteroid isomerase-like protein